MRNETTVPTRTLMTSSMKIGSIGSLREILTRLMTLARTRKTPAMKISIDVIIKIANTTTEKNAVKPNRA